MSALAYPQIRCWTTYWAEQLTSQMGDRSFTLFAFETMAKPERRNFRFAADTASTLWGFQAAGHARVHGREVSWSLRSGQWFCLADTALSVELGPASRMVAIQQTGYRGLNAMGGPVEPVGRLRYIDGCTDTLLCGPPLIGEPCLNLLHFPKCVDQSFHHHPSFRAGIVASGSGMCDCEGQSLRLESGTVFYLPPFAKHRFRTLNEEMTVIAFHPDSDWGPSHEVHPMINRTFLTPNSEAIR